MLSNVIPDHRAIAAFILVIIQTRKPQMQQGNRPSPTYLSSFESFLPVTSAHVSFPEPHLSNVHMHVRAREVESLPGRT